MKISYRWLRELVPTAKSAEEAGQVLTATGLEVEGIARVEDVPGGLAGLVVGHVVSREQHPNADRLSLCRVDVGEGGEPLSIVCGASNVREGLHVVVATVGATLHPVEGDPLKIKKGKIRGEVSEGMICAEDEIGVGISHDGIIELEAKWAPGTPAATVYGVGTDEVIEIGLTPNRTDGMSHVGVARDLAAGLRHETVQGIREEVDWTPGGDRQTLAEGGCPVKVEVADMAGAPRYCGCVLEGVVVGPSPEWVQRRLAAIGVGAINNVVDATNYVLHELGTPLHAFDADQISGNHITVRRATPGEAFTTLDGVERSLDSADLVIADAERPMCLAGVFGGSGSGVTAATTRVFIESAWFDPVSVRKTARRHGLSTDASFRFERGVDPALTWTAMERVVQLIQEWAGGTIAGTGGVCVELGEVPGPAMVSLTYAQLDGLIGERIDRTRVQGILASLDIDVLEATEASLTLRVPAYRMDVTRPADVIEEILRVHGFDRVPLPKRMAITLDVADGPDTDKARLRMSELLVSRGFSEIMNNSLTRASDAVGFLERSEREEPALRPEAFVEMLNPLSSDLAIMRQTLLFQGLETIARNRNNQHPNLRLFELGRTYRRKDEGGFEEREMVAMWMTGQASPENWNRPARAVGLMDLKGEVEALMEALGVGRELALVPGAEGLILEGVKFETWVRGERGRMVPSGEGVGRLGRVHPDALAVRDLAGVEVLYAEFDVAKLVALMEGRQVKASDLAKFPAVRRDLSLLVPEGVTFGQIAACAEAAGGKLVQSVGLFDVYVGEGLAGGLQSYAIKIVLQDAGKTLEDKQIDKAMQRILQALERETGARLRAQTPTADA